MGNPLVSIIVPIYNVNKYLKRCLDSIINQDYANIEIILVDDGSTDNSGSICDYYKSKDPRIIVMHKQNEGVSIARNSGINIARGEYICFSDSDDLLQKNYVSLLLEGIVDNNADMSIASSYNRGFLKSKKIIIPEKVIDFHSKKQDENCGIFTQSFMLAPWCKMFKKEIIVTNRIKFPVGIGYGEDTIFIYNYIKNCKKIVVINKDIYVYNSLLSTASRKFWPEMNYYCKMIFDAYCEMVNVCFNDLNAKVDEYALKLFEISACHYCQYQNQSDAIKNINKTYAVFSKYIQNYFDSHPKKEKADISTQDWSNYYIKHCNVAKKGVLNRLAQTMYKNIWSMFYQLGCF